ncbi:hypothetical protein KI688_000398 [Linnemannia hyalina]|uniref:Uncharacterized protein n=1 Tax=Linnemannia hyalina TaxID=64524 RepID=A0A9P8BZY3_9FUNG|nr:hypothetical protein KI688_000398 [Linnemannia hyalina]
MSLSNPTSFSSSPPTSSALSEHKPMPATQSKVHDLARRFSAISKQSVTENAVLGVPQTHQRKGSFGRTEGSKVSGLLNKFAEPKAISTALPSADSVFKSGDGSGARAKDVTGKEQQQQQQQGDETPQTETVQGVVADAEDDVDKEIESSLNVKDLLDKVLQLDLDLVDIPLSNGNNDDELAKETVEEPVSETIEAQGAETEEEEAKPAEQEHQKKEQKHVPGLLNDEDTGVMLKGSLDAASAAGKGEESLRHRDDSSLGVETENHSI